MKTLTDHFVMLWGDMLASSIIDEDLHVKWAFVVCLLLCDQNGDFRATPSYLARTAGMSVEEAEQALAILSTSDPRSTSKELDGVRVEMTGPNTYHVVNYRAYRERKERHLKREKWAEDKRRQRGSGQEVDSGGQGVDTSGHEVDEGGQGVDPSTSTYTSTSPSSSSTKKKRKGEIEFFEFWEEYPRKVGRPKAESRWRNLTVKDQHQALAALPDHLRAWTGKEKQFIPHASTWINQRRWEDDLESERSTPSHMGVGAHEEVVGDDEESEKRRILMKHIMKHSRDLLTLEGLSEQQSVIVRSASEELSALAESDMPLGLMEQKFYTIHDGMMGELAVLEGPELYMDYPGKGVKQEVWARKRLQKQFGIPDPLEYEFAKEDLKKADRRSKQWAAEQA